MITDTRLEIGRAFKTAYPYFESEETNFTINSDSLIDTNINAFDLLEEMRDTKVMDFL